MHLWWYEWSNINSLFSCQLYFRELPVPLLTYSLYSSFVRAIRSDMTRRHILMRQTIHRLSSHNYRYNFIVKIYFHNIKMLYFRTLSHLLRHLHHVSQSSHVTGMTCRNLALVWSPNLLRPQHETSLVSEESLRDIGVQARCIEFMIQHYHQLFTRDQATCGIDVSLHQPHVSSQNSVTNQKSFHGSFTSLRPKLLPACREGQLLSLQPETLTRELLQTPSVNNYKVESHRPDTAAAAVNNHETKHLPKVNNLF